MKTTYPLNRVLFRDPINAASIAKLIVNINKGLASNEFIGLDIDSAGGSVTYALEAYDALLANEKRIITRNVGTVGSSAILLYCAATRRFALPAASFVVHTIHTVIGTKSFSSSDDLSGFLKLLEAENGEDAAEALGQPSSETAINVVKDHIALRHSQAERYVRIVQSRIGLDPKKIGAMFLSDPESTIDYKKAFTLKLINEF